MILINVTICNITSLTGYYECTCGAMSNDGDLTLINCTLYNNKVTHSYGGGAISTEGGNLTLINSILYNNSPKVHTETIHGGSINFDKCNLILINNISYNTATNGSIMHLDGFRYNSGNISLYNNNLYNNTVINTTLNNPYIGSYITIDPIIQY